jgi:hypothetical protein
MMAASPQCPEPARGVPGVAPPTIKPDGEAHRERWSEGGGVGFRGLDEVPGAAAVEWLDGARQVDVNERVELARGAGGE